MVYMIELCWTVYYTVIHRFSWLPFGNMTLTFITCFRDVHWKSTPKSPTAPHSIHWTNHLPFKCAMFRTLPSCWFYIQLHKYVYIYIFIFIFKYIYTYNIYIYIYISIIHIYIYPREYPLKPKKNPCKITMKCQLNHYEITLKCQWNHDETTITPYFTNKNMAKASRIKTWSAPSKASGLMSSRRYTSRTTSPRRHASCTMKKNHLPKKK